MPAFFGFEHRFGIRSGQAIGRLHIFRSRGARDRWIARGPIHIQDHGAREVLTPCGDQLTIMRALARNEVERHAAR